MTLSGHPIQKDPDRLAAENARLTAALDDQHEVIVSLTRERDAALQALIAARLAQEGARIEPGEGKMGQDERSWQEAAQERQQTVSKISTPAV